MKKTLLTLALTILLNSCSPKNEIPEVYVPEIKLDMILVAKKVNDRILVGIDKDYDGNIDLVAIYDSLPNPSWVNDDYKLELVDFNE